MAQWTDIHREQIALRKTHNLRGISTEVEIDLDFMFRLEADTVRLDGNPRLKSSAANLKNLVEMRERGISLLDNPKGDMLVGRIDGTYIIGDGLHTFRSTKELAKMKGEEQGDYRVRVHFMTAAEQRYFAIFGDGHFKPRTTAEVATLVDSRGNTIAKGGLKTKICQIADKLHSFSIGQYGGDKKTAADRTMQFHEDYKAEIEFVTGFSALMALKKSRENNSAVLAVFCDAIRKLGDPVKVLFRQFASLTYTDDKHEHSHATHLLNWVRDQKIQARSGTQNVVMGTSFWIAGYVLGWPAYRKDGKKISTDTTHYFIADAVRQFEVERQFKAGKAVANKLRALSKAA